MTVLKTGEEHDFFDHFIKLSIKFPGFDFVCNIDSLHLYAENYLKARVESPAVLVCLVLAVVNLSIICHPFGTAD